MKWFKAIGSFFALILAAIIYSDLRPNKKAAIAKKKKMAKEQILAKLNKNDIKYDKVRRSIRDSGSTIVKCLTLILLLNTMVHAKYLVWDKEDKVWRDYGTSINYINILEAEKDTFLENRASNKMIVTNEIVKFIDKNCVPTWWESNGDWVAAVVVSIGWSLIFLL